MKAVEAKRLRQLVVVLVPSEQSSDLRDYLAKHTKTDRLDADSA